MARQSEIASQSTTVVVYTGDKAKEYSVKKHGTERARCSAAMRRRRSPRWRNNGEFGGDKRKE